MFIHPEDRRPAPQLAPIRVAPIVTTAAVVIAGACLVVLLHDDGPSAEALAPVTTEARDTARQADTPRRELEIGDPVLVVEEPEPATELEAAAPTPAKRASKVRRTRPASMVESARGRGDALERLTESAGRLSAGE